MGDIGTHAKIADQIISALKTVRDNEDYIFFEVGNWFTDTSQMRDPFAHISGKKVIWDIGVKTAHKENVIANFPALAEMVLDLSYELDNYLDELMGLPGPAGGLLAQYFLDFFFIDGLEKFRRQGVDPDEFEELFRPSRSERAGAPVAIMTQYYPHEHVDFPPWPFHDIVGERKPSQAALHQCPAPPAAGSGRRLYQYTEDQLVYLSISTPWWSTAGRSCLSPIRIRMKRSATVTTCWPALGMPAMPSRISSSIPTLPNAPGGCAANRSRIKAQLPTPKTGTTKKTK